ncbi:MAG TPA: hypothetical protein VIJ76_05525, partial [Galbitalea sp.]
LSRVLPKDAPLPLGRVITFEAPVGAAKSGLMLHRLVGVNKDGSLVTAGDANAAPDSTPLARANIIGRACVLIPWIGLPALWANTGAIWPLAAWLLITALAILIEVLTSRSEHRRRPQLPTSTIPSPADAPGSRHPKRPLRLARTVIRLGIRPLLLLAVVAMVATLTAVAPVAQVNASFSARTSSVGNSWTSAAAAPAVRLAFITNPSGSTDGVAFSTQPVIAYQDAAGHTTTSGGSVTLALTNSNGAVLTCATNPVVSVVGVSTFAGCSIDKPGTYTLMARSGALIVAVSAAVKVILGPASGLRFLAIPSATRANTTFSTPPQVAVVDAGGNVVSSTAPVTLVLTNPSGASVICAANPQAAVAGIATFAGCRIDIPGTYTLTARSPGLSTVTSASFTISGPALPLLSCQSAIWIATFSWSPTPYTPTQYTLYINGIQVQAVGADGWNSYVQLTLINVPASQFPQGTATLEVRKVIAGGQEVVIGDGTVVLGGAGFRTYTCG